MQALAVGVRHRRPRVLRRVGQPAHRVGPRPCRSWCVHGKALQLQCGARLAKGTPDQRGLGRLQRDSVRHRPASLEACRRQARGEREGGFCAPHACQRRKRVGRGQKALAALRGPPRNERMCEPSILRVALATQPLRVVVPRDSALRVVELREQHRLLVGWSAALRLRHCGRGCGAAERRRLNSEGREVRRAASVQRQPLD
jgi:hypothetical protein